MRTPGEIKKAIISCFGTSASCVACPYKECDLEEINMCEEFLCDMIDYIVQLEETICLMKIQMRGDCGCCKHGGDGDMRRCNECLSSREYHPIWEYEGLPEVEVYEQSEMPVLR